MKLGRWLPHLATLVLAALLVLTKQVWATPIAQQLGSTTSASSNRTISYQGYLTDASGNPVNATPDMVFRFYDVESGGAALWTETQSAVPVNDGLFSVLLGSVQPLSQTLFLANDDLWLGVSIGADEEMVPREKIASAPYALASELPAGIIVMWSGTLGTIPPGWSLCDGTNGTPDLRDRFVVGAGSSYAIGDAGGVVSVTLTMDQIPLHSHTATTSVSGSHTHQYYKYHGTGGNERGGQYSTVDLYAVNTSSSGDHNHTITVESAGGGLPHENRPPYYSLAFICKQ